MLVEGISEQALATHNGFFVTPGALEMWLINKGLADNGGSEGVQSLSRNQRRWS